MEIKNTADLSNQFLKILAYGDPGNGKTRFAGSMAQRFKTLVISAESGLLSIRNLKDDKGKELSVDYVNVNKYEDLEEYYQFLRLSKHAYKAVAIDSLTEIQKSCKDFIMGKKDAMEMRDWGALALKIERMVRAYRDLPLHVVVTALGESETDKTTGEVTFCPMLQGSVQRVLPSYFDEVFYFFSKEVVEGAEKKLTYNILTRNSGKFIGKDRSGRLPAVVSDPDFGKVYDMIYGASK